ERQLLHHVELGEADVGPVEVGDDVQDEQQRDDPPEDLAADGARVDRERGNRGEIGRHRPRSLGEQGTGTGGLYRRGRSLGCWYGKRFVRVGNPRMRLADLFDSRPFVLSFEVYPPKTDAGRASLAATIERLAGYAPGFVSCTYGAGGSTRG